MVYSYVKALHIVFIVTWFSGLFYLVRLFVYIREADDKPQAEQDILKPQLLLMARRLLFGITLPSAILTAIFGTWMLYLYDSFPPWVHYKLAFVVLLYGYHISLHKIYKDQTQGNFALSSQQLRMWNEAPTVLLIAIIFLVVVKSGMSVVYGLVGLTAFIVLLMGSIQIYKKRRTKNTT